MNRTRTAVAASLLAVPLLLLIVACATTVATNSEQPAASTLPAASDPMQRAAHAQKVMSSRFCADCHPAIYAEHEQNTHGRAFTDEEVRLGTGRFDHGDCIRCHTPRPIFETGIGNNPMQRFYGLEEGNSCMTCHWRPDYDYAGFAGGKECRDAFHPEVGKVEACASCHRNHGTPYQWELAPTGKEAGRQCITCHMPLITRPVAVGAEPKPVHSHAFPASRSEKHLRRAYTYEARIAGDHVVVAITNRGAGHNFPTELKQRSVESLIVVRDPDGQEIARSRMVFRDPYKRPYGLELPVNTQIPAGQTREHRVPLQVADGYVDCELHYKLYFPIEDNHPELARQLETKRLPFTGVTPSTAAVVSEPDVKVVVPEGISVEAASPADLVDYARPAIAAVAVSLPEGDDDEAIGKLIDLFQFPVPEANVRARARLKEIGAKAVPALVLALGSWDNKTFKQAQKVLQSIGAPAEAAVVAALGNDSLYVRHHAREIVANMQWRHDGAVATEVAKWLDAKNALDRADAAQTLGALGVTSMSGRIRKGLQDPEPDVVRASALALARLGDREAVPDIVAAMQRAPWVETRIDLALALGTLGSADGVPVLLEGLDHGDDLIREDAFEALFAISGRHMGFVPTAPRPERLECIARLQGAWAESGGSSWARKKPDVDAKTDAHAFHLVEEVGGGTGLVPAGDDEAIVAELKAMGETAVPALVRGLKFPPGFADKRAKILLALGQIGSRRAAPALVATLQDPVVSVAAWACWALASCGDDECLPGLQRWRDRVRSLAAAGRLPETAGGRDVLLAQVAGTRLVLGDRRAQGELAELLLSDDVAARRAAIEALVRATGDARGYDPEASAEARLTAAAKWLETR